MCAHVETHIFEMGLCYVLYSSVGRILAKLHKSLGSIPSTTAGMVVLPGRSEGSVGRISWISYVPNGNQHGWATGVLNQRNSTGVGWSVCISSTVPLCRKELLSVSRQVIGEWSCSGVRL